MIVCFFLFFFLIIFFSICQKVSNRRFRLTKLSDKLIERCTTNRVFLTDAIRNSRIHETIHFRRATRKNSLCFSFAFKTHQPELESPRRSGDVERDRNEREKKTVLSVLLLAGYSNPIVVRRVAIRRRCGAKPLLDPI